MLRPDKSLIPYIGILLRSQSALSIQLTIALLKKHKLQHPTLSKLLLTKKLYLCAGFPYLSQVMVPHVLTNLNKDPTLQILGNFFLSFPVVVW